MSIEFGMPTLIELKGLEENAKLCNSLGFKFIELNMNLTQYQVESMKRNKIFQDISKEYNVYYTIHLDENLNISDFNNTVTKAYLETVKQTLTLAKELAIPILNMHMNKGVYFTLPDQKIFLFDKYRDTYLKNIQYFRTMCETLIGGDNVNISIENTEGFTTFQKEAIDKLNIARRNHCRCVIETKTVASLQESLNWLVTHWSNK